MRLQNNFNDVTETASMLSWQAVSTDLVTSLCGTELGQGATRATYVYNLDPRYVIKVETENGGHNLIEYLLWEEVKGLTGSLSWVKEWFAPILWISPNGRLLVMRRTYEKPKKVRPDKVPAFFADIKRDNWGWIGNKFVCHDYGFIYKFITYKNKFTKITKDIWW